MNLKEIVKYELPQIEAMDKRTNNLEFLLYSTTFLLNLTCGDYIFKATSQDIYLKIIFRFVYIYVKSFKDIKLKSLLCIMLC